MAQEKEKTANVKKPAEKLAVAEKPAVALVPEAPAEPKRRGRPAGSAPKTTTTTTKRARKGGNPGALFLAETETGSGLFEIRPTLDVPEVLELGEAGRRVIATTKWREF